MSDGGTRDWREFANKVMRERGKLVMRSPRKLQIGEIVLDCRPTPRDEPEQPFRVIAVTDYSDYCKQSEHVGLGRKPPTLPEDTFYIVITD